MHVLFPPLQRLVQLQQYRLVVRSRGTLEELEYCRIPEYLNYLILVYRERGLRVVPLRLPPRICFRSVGWGGTGVSSSQAAAPLDSSPPVSGASRLALSSAC